MNKQVSTVFGGLLLALISALILGSGKILIEANAKPTMAQVEFKINEINKENTKSIDTLTREFKDFQAETRESFQSVLILQLHVAHALNIKLSKDLTDPLEKKIDIFSLLP